MSSPFTTKSTRPREFCQGKFSTFREEVATWLNRFNWEWWATFTFKRPHSPYSAKRAFKRFFMPSDVYYSDQADLYGFEDPDIDEDPGIDYFYAAEWHGDHHGVHIHALMKNTLGRRRLTTMDKWYKRYGRARIWPYKKNLGAHYYVCKYIVKSVADWDISVGERKFYT